MAPHQSMMELEEWLKRPLQQYPSELPPLPDGIEPYTPPGAAPEPEPASAPGSGTGTGEPVSGFDTNTEWMAGQAVDFADHILANSAKWLNEAPSAEPYRVQSQTDKEFLKRRWLAYMEAEHPDFRLTPRQALMLAYAFAYGRGFVMGLWNRLQQLGRWLWARYKARSSKAESGRTSAQPPKPPTPAADEEIGRQLVATLEEKHGLSRDDIQEMMNKAAADAARAVRQSTAVQDAVVVEPTGRELIPATREHFAQRKAQRLCLHPTCDKKLNPKQKNFCGNEHKNYYLLHMNQGNYPNPREL